MDQLSEEQLKALNAVMQGHNILVTGQAGTGKSFWVKKVARTLKRAGKNVALTSTTGIAALNFHDTDTNATTVNRWAGILDGRYSLEDLTKIVPVDDRFSEVRKSVTETDVLIIDEISMLSRKIFEQLEVVCCMSKDSSKLFGGLQLVATGDFWQLPPVSNPFQNDDGAFCFTSTKWEIMFPHHFCFETIHRQVDKCLISIIKETALGEVSEESEILLESLKRPLPADRKPVHLFSTKYHAAVFNSERLEKIDGEQMTYRAVDKAEAGYNNSLKRIRAPKILAVKIGCPVLLLKNISNHLVNGLQGIVSDMRMNEIDVSFPQINIRQTFGRERFDVYSSREKKVVACRTQFPLELSFGITFHKSQGLTLPDAVIHCKGAFEPGQISVGLGRVSSTDHLQVLDFKKNLCKEPASEISNFYERCTKRFQNSLSCCKDYVNLCSTLEEKEPMEDREVISFDSSTEFDEQELRIIDDLELENIINISHIDLNFDQNQATVLPFDPRVLFNKCTEVYQGTPMSSNMSSAVDFLSQNQESFRIWSVSQYSHLKSILVKIMPKIPDEKTSAKDWSLFYREFNIYLSSEAFLESVQKLFCQRENISEFEHHLATSLFLDIQAEVLKEMSLKCTHTEEESIPKQKELSSAGIGKIRYVGGMCIAKERYKNQQTVVTHLFNPKEKNKVTKSKKIVEILDSVICTMSDLAESSEDVDSLEQTQRKQNVRQGLTHISDRCSDFFVLVTSCIQSHLNKRNLNIQQQELLQYVLSACLESPNIVKSWMLLFPHEPDNLVLDILHNILARFVKVSGKQFRKDMMDELKIEKRQAHRKQIMEKTEKDKAKIGKITFKDITGDQSENHKSSHQKLRILTMDNVDYFAGSDFTKIHLQLLCIAYGLDFVSKETKKTLNDKLIKLIQDGNLSEIPNAIPNAYEGPVRATRSKGKGGKGKGKGKGKKQVVCPECSEPEKDDGQAWIQCDICDIWWHKKCTSLTESEWQHLQEEEDIWGCSNCTVAKKRKRNN